MAKKRLKSSKCLNCGYDFEQLQGVNNYCPACGQENNDRNKSLKSYFANFVDDLTSIDNRFYSSIPYFLFKPGYLTKFYMEGRRKNYVSPLRLYLAFSFFYFFLFSYTYKQNISVSAKSNKKTFKQILEDSPKAQLQVIPGYDFKKIILLSDKSTSEILDSLRLKPTLINTLVVRQGKRLAKQTPEGAINNFIEEIPISLFVLLPVFTLILKLAYIRRRRYFIEHFTFILHIHSFLFFIIGITQFLEYIFPVLDEFPSIIALILSVIYTYKAIRNYYQQSRFKSILKIITVGLLYLIIFIIWLVLTFLFSLLFF